MIRKFLISLMASSLWVFPVRASAQGTLGECPGVKVVGLDTGPRDDFGGRVAIFGNIAVISAQNGGNSGPPDGPGAVYVFERRGGIWFQIAKLTSSDIATDDEFGGGVAIWGDVIVVGALMKNGQTGAVYVFVKPPEGWRDMTETARLIPSQQRPGDAFGTVAIHRDVIAASATESNSGGPGRVYIFVKPENGWVTTNETAVLLASDGVPGDNLGRSIAMNENWIIAGADQEGSQGAGKAYVFSTPFGGWSGIRTEEAILVSSDGASNDHFGHSVALRGDLVAVGAFAKNNPTFRSGAANLFDLSRLTPGANTETTRLIPASPLQGGNLGIAVAIENDGCRVFVGRYFGDDGTRTTPGSVVYFDRPAEGWSAEAHESGSFQAPEAAPGVFDSFGTSLAYENGILAVGATRAISAAGQSGAGYLFSEGCNFCAPACLGSFRIVPAGPFSLSVRLSTRIALRGFQIGIAIDPTLLSVSRVAAGAGLPESMARILVVDRAPLSGCAPEMEVTAGLTAGVILSEDQSVVLGPGDDIEVLTIDFDWRCAASIGDCAAFRFVDCLGPVNGRITNLVVGADGLPVPACVEDGEACRLNAAFKRGDSNVDGDRDISDPVTILMALFLEGSSLQCEDAADANDDGVIDISDTLYLVQWLFQQGPQPPVPFPGCGDDPTMDTFGCRSYPAPCTDC